MSFRVPTFNLTCNIWRNGFVPPSPPAVVSVCNLAWGQRVNTAASGGTGSVGVVFACLSLLLPRRTDIRASVVTTDQDYVEVPAGSGRFYNALMVDDIGRGFANEHRCALLMLAPPYTWPLA